jgi:chemotaxis response regulator CheB
VWGMPAAAQELDAVDLELPLNQIGAAIVRGVRRRRTSTRAPQ